MVIETKDYGFKAYLMLKFLGEQKPDGSVEVNDDLAKGKKKFDIYSMYQKSEFSVYNEILKCIVKGKNC